MLTQVERDRLGLLKRRINTAKALAVLPTPDRLINQMLQWVLDDWYRELNQLEFEDVH
jgi:hypothetical protein